MPPNCRPATQLEKLFGIVIVKNPLPAAWSDDLLYSLQLAGVIRIEDSRGVRRIPLSPQQSTASLVKGPNGEPATAELEEVCHTFPDAKNASIITNNINLSP